MSIDIPGRDYRALNVAILSLMYALGGTVGLLIGVYTDHFFAALAIFWGVFVCYLSYFVYVWKTPEKSIGLEAPE